MIGSGLESQVDGVVWCRIVPICYVLMYGEYGGLFEWQIAFNITAYIVLNLQPGKVSHTLQQDYYPLIEGMFSLPINLPWTMYGKAVKVKILPSIAEFRARLLQFFFGFISWCPSFW